MTQLRFAMRYRCDVAARAAAAVGGGYLLTAVASSLIATLLPMPRADAAIVGTMLSFAIYACTVIWVFAARSAFRTWTGIVIASTLLGMLLWILRSAQ